jgi:hypothetical protein
MFQLPSEVPKLTSFRGVTTSLRHESWLDLAITDVKILDHLPELEATPASLLNRIASLRRDDIKWTVHAIHRDEVGPIELEQLDIDANQDELMRVKVNLFNFLGDGIGLRGANKKAQVRFGKHRAAQSLLAFMFPKLKRYSDVVSFVLNRSALTECIKAWSGVVAKQDEQLIHRLRERMSLFIDESSSSSSSGGRVRVIAQLEYELRAAKLENRFLRAYNRRLCKSMKTAFVLEAATRRVHELVDAKPDDDDAAIEALLNDLMGGDERDDEKWTSSSSSSSTSTSSQ